MSEKSPCVYMLASAPYGTLYIGVSSELRKRVWKHKNATADGFCKKYKVNRLVWIELHATMYLAISREKNLKTGSGSGRSASSQNRTHAGLTSIPTFDASGMANVYKFVIAGLTRNPYQDGYNLRRKPC